MEPITILALLLGALLGGGAAAFFFLRRAHPAADELQRLRGDNEVLTRELAVAAALAQAAQGQLVDLEERRRVSAADANAARSELGDAKATCAKLEQRTADYARKEAEISQLRETIATTQDALSAQARRVAVLEIQIQDDQRLAEDKLKTLHLAKAEMEATFKGIAAQVLQQNTEKFETNTKLRLGEMLQPLGERIKEFEAKVQDTHKRDIEDRSVLHAEIKRVVSASQKLDQDAVNLTKALKGDTQVQGAWGEVVLERILEQSGLREGTEYVRQESLKDDNDRRQRPDVIVHLPGQRDVIVDAKMSLTAYEAYCVSMNEDDRSGLLARHIESVRAHVKELSDKEYWRLSQVHTTDFVLMFIPVEPAFIEALRHDPSLFEYAFQKRIVLTSPTTLLAVLKTIEHAWHVERHNESAREIVRQAGALYDKLRGFVTDLQDVGARLGQAQVAYNGALGKLSTGKGNVISRAERLRALGVKVKAPLPQDLIDHEPSLHAAELVGDAVRDDGVLGSTDGMGTVV